jgi:ankyrin repeat protein
MAIHYAAEAGNQEMVTMLMARPNSIVSLPDDQGNTPAKLALANGYEPIAILLGKVKFKAALDARNYRGKPDSLDALLAGNPALAKMHLEGSGLTALQVMSAQGDAEAVELLLEYGALPNALTDDGRTALFMAAERPESSGPNAAASEQDRARVVRLLLAKGAIVSICKETSPLHLAADRARTDMMQAFVDDKDARLSLNLIAKNQTPLLVAIEKGRWQVARLLLEQKEVQADWTDDDNSAALQHAAAGGDAPTVLALVDLTGDRRVDLSRQTAGGKDTALMLAVKHNDPRTNSHLEVIQLLAGHDAGLAKLADKNKDTPLIVSARNGSVEIVNLLIRQSDLHAMNSASRTALCEAAATGASMEVVKALLDGDQDPDFADRKIAIALADAGKFPLLSAAIRATIPEQRPPVVIPRPVGPDAVADATAQPVTPNPLNGVPPQRPAPVQPDASKNVPPPIAPGEPNPVKKDVPLAPGEPTFSGTYTALVSGKTVTLTFSNRVRQWVYQFEGNVHCQIQGKTQLILTSPDDLFSFHDANPGGYYTFSGTWTPTKSAGEVTEFKFVPVGRAQTPIVFRRRP